MHYVLETGLFHAPPEEVRVLSSQEDALELAEEWYDLSTEMLRRLEAIQHVYLDVIKDGADYVEFYACNCQHPLWHTGSVERRQFSHDSASRITVTAV